MPSFTKRTSDPSFSGERGLLFDVTIAELIGLRVPTKYLLPLILSELEFLCTSDLDHLRRIRPKRVQFRIFQGCVSRSWTLP